MDICDGYAEMLNWAHNYGITTRGSFLSPRDAGRLAVIPKIANSVSRHVDDALKVGVNIRQGIEKEWNVAMVLCGDGSSGLEDGSFHGSGSPDGVACKFWLMEWDSLQLSWKHSNPTGIVSWPHRPVTVPDRCHLDRGLALARPYVQIRAPANEPNIALLKNIQKEWLESNQGFGIIGGGPQARPANAHLSRYFIRCFGETFYKGHTERNCVINAMCNAFFLFLGKSQAQKLVRNLPASILATSTRCRPFDDDKPEISDLILLGQIQPILQQAGGYLSIKKFKIPRHSHREPPEVRFNWLFSKNYYGRLFVLRLFE